jgi:hypothetical protein
MSIEEGLARLMMSGHRNSPVFREQIERARTLKRRVEGNLPSNPVAPRQSGRDRSVEFQPIARPNIVRTIVDAAD